MSKSAISMAIFLPPWPSWRPAAPGIAVVAKSATTLGFMISIVNGLELQWLGFNLSIYIII